MPGAETAEVTSQDQAARDQGNAYQGGWKPSCRMQRNCPLSCRRGQPTGDGSDSVAAIDHPPMDTMPSPAPQCRAAPIAARTPAQLTIQADGSHTTT